MLCNWNERFCYVNVMEGLYVLFISMVIYRKTTNNILLAYKILLLVFPSNKKGGYFFASFRNK